MRHSCWGLKMRARRDLRGWRREGSKASSGAAKQWEVGSRGRRMTARTAPTSVFSMHESPSSFLLSFLSWFDFPLFSSLLGSLGFSMHGEEAQGRKGERGRSLNKIQKTI